MKSICLLILICFSVCKALYSQDENSIERPEIFLNKGIQSNISYYGVGDVGTPCLIATAGVTETIAHFLRISDLKEFNQSKLENIPGVRLSSSSIFFSGTNVLGVRGFNKNKENTKNLFLYDIISGRLIDSLKTFSKFPKTYITRDDQNLVCYNYDSLMVYDISKKKIKSLLKCSNDKLRITIYKVLFDNNSDKLLILYNYFGSKVVEIKKLDGSVICSFKDIDNAFLVSKNRLCLIRGGITANFYNLDDIYSGSATSMPVSKAVLPFPVDDNCRLSYDGKYLFFKKMSLTEQEYKAQKLSLEMKFPHKIQDSLLFVLDMEMSIVKDSIRMVRDYGFVYEETSQKIFYEYVDKKKIKKITSYDLISKKNTFVSVLAFQPVSSIAFSKTKGVLAAVMPNSGFPIKIYNTAAGTTSALPNPFIGDDDKNEKKTLLLSKQGKYLIYYNYSKMFVYDGNFSGVPRTYSLPGEIFVDVTCSLVDSIVYVQVFNAVYRLNIQNGWYNRVFNRAGKTRPNLPVMLNDSIGYYYNVKYFDRKGKKITKEKAGEEYNASNNEAHSLYFISLKTWDTLYHFEDTSKYKIFDKSLHSYKIENIIYDDSSGKYLIYGDYKRYILDLDNKMWHEKQDSLLFPATVFNDGNSCIYNERYYFDINNGTICLRNRKTNEIELQMAGYEENNEPVNWLVISKEGNFEGNSSVLRFFFWRDKKSYTWYSYDAFYNSFFTSKLLDKKLRGELDHTLDISFYIKVPGLSEMLETKHAVIKRVNDQDYLMIKNSNIHNLILQDIQGLELNDTDAEFPFRIRIPRGSVQKNKVVSAVKIDSSYFFKPEHKGDLYICTIGINEYSKSSKLDSLPYSELSARNISQLFSNNIQQLSKVFSTVNIEKPLIDTCAKRKDIVSKVNYFINKVKTDDCVVFYFIGHGIIPTGSQLFYFFPYDGINGSNEEIERTGLSAASIADIANFIPASRILIIIDACQSGGVNESLSKVTQNKDFLSEVSSVSLIASSTPYQFSIQASDGSYLSKRLVDGVNKFKSQKQILTIDQFVKTIGNSSNTSDSPVQKPEYFRYGNNYPLFDFRP